MKRRDAAVAIGLGLAYRVVASAAEAPPAGRVYRIGYLSAPTRESVERGVQAGGRRLHELGWD